MVVDERAPERWEAQASMSETKGVEDGHDIRRIGACQIGRSRIGA
jgi:hypothetical protein